MIPNDYTRKLLIEEAMQATKKVFSKWSEEGSGSGAAVLTNNNKVYSARHMSFPSGSGSHAETLALMIAAQNDPEDYVVACAVISTKNSEKIQYPCGACIQTFVDYLDILSTKKIISDKNDLDFICANSKKEYEIININKLAPYKWETNK